MALSCIALVRSSNRLNVTVRGYSIRPNALWLVLVLVLDLAVTKIPKFHHITPILKSLDWLKINERIFLSHINLSKLVNLLTSVLLFNSFHIVVLVSSSTPLVTFSNLSS